MARFFVGAEQQCDAPDACKTYQRVNDSRQKSGLTAQEKGHGVEAEQADSAPVQGADNGQQQCDSVK